MNKEWFAHLKGSGVNISNEKTKILVNTALFNQVKVFIAAFQGRNNCINNCHIFAKYNAIVDKHEYNTILSKEDTFINLTLNKIARNESFE
jgi:endonuclease IV